MRNKKIDLLFDAFEWMAIISALEMLLKTMGQDYPAKDAIAGYVRRIEEAIR